VKLLLLGMNHRTAPIEMRERFAVPDLAPVLGKLAGVEEIGELVLVSTCNRVEIVATSHHPEAACLRLGEFFSRSGLADGDLPVAGDHLYEYRDRDVVRHVFRVASAMDSMVVGEPQVLGQLKQAYRTSIEIGTCGPVLSRLFQRAFATAKRVRNETRIAERPVSVAKVAVDLARKIFERLDDKSALLVGAGEMVEAALYALRREGLADLRVANRTLENAQELAARFSASAHGLDQLDTLLAEADIVLTSVASQEPLLTRDRMRSVLRARRNRPCFLIDLGVPRNVSPAVNELDNAYLYDIDDLQEIAASNAGARRREAEQGERIVLEEAQRFDGWLMALQAVPTIRHLRARADAIRLEELRRFSGSSELDDEALERVEGLTRSLVNKILHAPLARLRAQTDREEGLAVLEAARELFALDDESAPGAQIDGEFEAGAAGVAPRGRGAGNESSE
jgi:glutamyl-tRNA reductase